jgi:hypothetical protein
MNTPANPPRRLVGKKLLVASLGVAALSYVGVAESPLSDNLVSPADTDLLPRPIPHPPPTSGNLMPPPDTLPRPRPIPIPIPPPTSGNLMAPPILSSPRAG